jgi:hypothetical protein
MKNLQKLCLSKVLFDADCEIFFCAFKTYSKYESENWAVEDNDKFAGVLKARNYPSLKLDLIKIPNVGYLTESPIS